MSVLAYRPETLATAARRPSPRPVPSPRDNLADGSTAFEN